MAEGMLSLSWNNHSATFCGTLANLKAKDTYADATITCEGKFYPVHKLVLSTCSEYFERIFEHTSCRHPVIVLNIQAADLEAILSYMYDGAVNVDQTNLPQLIKVAELLQIKGLAVPDEPPPPPTLPSASIVVDSGSVGGSGSEWESHVRSSPECRRKGAHSQDTQGSPLHKRLRRDRQARQYDRSSPVPSPSDMHEVTEDFISPEKSMDEHVERGERESGEDGKSPQQAAEFELEIKEETMEVNKGEAGAQITEGMYESIGGEEETHVAVAAAAAAAVSDNTEESAQLMMMKLDQAGSTGHPGDFMPQTTQDPYVHELAVTIPGPSDVQQLFGGEHVADLSLAKGGLGTKGAGFPLSVPQHVHKQVEMQEVHPKREGREVSPKIHPCPYCKYSTWKKVNLTKHLRIHTGERPYPCPYCQARFSRKQCLTRHIRTHTGEKPYGCTQCPYRAIRKQSLVAHISTHHKHTK